MKIIVAPNAFKGSLSATQAAQAITQRARGLVRRQFILTREPAAPEQPLNGHAGAEAALEAASLNLNFTRVTSPINGRVSRAEVTRGVRLELSDVRAATSARNRRKRVSSNVRVALKGEFVKVVAGHHHELPLSTQSGRLQLPNIAGQARLVTKIEQPLCLWR